MQFHRRSLSRLRPLILLLTALSACAAANPSAPAGTLAATHGAAPFAAMLLARHALAEGDMDAASEQYQRLLAAEPDDADLQQRAFLTTVLAGRPEAVRVARMLPNNPSAQLLLAGQEIKDGNWRAAEARFAGLPATGLMQLIRPMLLAWTATGSGHADAAMEILRPWTQGQRLRPVYELNAAMIADLAGNNADAGRYYRAALGEMGGANLQIARLYASWLVRQGQRAEAEKVMLRVTTSDDVAVVMPAVMKAIGERQVRQASDGVAQVYLSIAAILQGQDSGDFPAVLLRLALALKPEFSAARLMLADIALGGRHPEAALPLLTPIGLDDPLNAIARMRRAVALQATGKSDAAIGLLEQLARDLPGQPQPLIAAADILRGQQRYTEAVTTYDRAVALIPNPTRAHGSLFYSRGIALDRSKQWERAEADFLHALQLYPDQPFVLNYLGYSWTEQGKNMDRARQMIERAAALRPDDGAIIDSLGWVVLKQGDAGNAVKHLERAVELEPTDATITAHLGDAYKAAGRLLEAGFQWRRALALHPDPQDVPALQAKIAANDKLLSMPLASAH